MDIVDKATRSRMMAGIKGKDTQPEMAVRRYLHARGFRYRVHDKRFPGRPDIVLPRFRVAIFVHGCFWHQHPGCDYATKPDANKQTWSAKFQGNVERDAKNVSALIDGGWHVIVVWECGVRGKNANSRLDWLVKAISNPSSSYIEWPSVSAKPGAPNEEAVH